MCCLIINTKYIISGIFSGMLVVGFMLANIPSIDIANDIHPVLSSSLRSIALVVILVHAGLGLDAQVCWDFFISFQIKVFLHGTVRDLY